MTGIAAFVTFGPDRSARQAMRALSDALALRGNDEVVARHGPARLLVRSASPKIHETGGMAVVVDGIAAPHRLATKYALEGMGGLLSGTHPYALVLAIPRGLVLARHLDGPALYYANATDGVLVASEPTALLAAGIPMAVNETTVSRFLESGACDEVPDTFFDAITKVLPGQIVEISSHNGGWVISAHPPVEGRSARPSVRTALLGALGNGMKDLVVAGAGQDDIAVPTAALLGAALAGRESGRPIRVYSNPLASPENSGVADLLDPIPPDAVRHRALPFFTDDMDVDGYLMELGEPLPGLASYLLWATAKATAAEVDELSSAMGWRDWSAHLSRLADRVAARHGVALHFPFRELDGADDKVRDELKALARRMLPDASVRAAASGLEPSLSEVLQRLRSELATALLYPQHGPRDRAALDGLRRLDELPVGELERLWRLYLVQRWRSLLAGRRQASIPASRPAAAEELSASGRVWQRHVLASEQLLEHDRVGERIASLVGEFASDETARQGMRQPWYILVAAKPLAVAQGRATAIWDIAPGRLARLLTRLRGHRSGRCRARDPWTMQVAIEEAGRSRMTLALLAARLGRRAWARRLAGPAWWVSPPRERACPPAHLAVVAPPYRADDTAGEIVNSLRRRLPHEILATLGGCAIVSVDDEGVRRLGWAGPRDDPGLVVRLCDQNPFGQGDERTPVVVAMAVSQPAAAPDRRSSHWPSHSPGGRPARRPSRRLIRRLGRQQAG